MRLGGVYSNNKFKTFLSYLTIKNITFSSGPPVCMEASKANGFLFHVL
jgi:hypothetical protein